MQLPILAMIWKGDGISCRATGDSPKAWPENNLSFSGQELAVGKGLARAAGSSDSGGSRGSLLGPWAAWGAREWSHIPGCSGNVPLGLGVPGTSGTFCAGGCCQCSRSVALGQRGWSWGRSWCWQKDTWWDYSQAETMAIRESGLHLASLRAQLSNSCFNQRNCKILQFP